MARKNWWSETINGETYCKDCGKTRISIPKETCRSAEHHRYQRNHAKSNNERALAIRILSFYMVSGGELPQCSYFYPDGTRCKETDIRRLTLNHLAIKTKKGQQLMETMVRSGEIVDAVNILCASHNAEFEYVAGRKKFPEGIDPTKTPAEWAYNRLGKFANVKIAKMLKIKPEQD